MKHDIEKLQACAKQTQPAHDEDKLTDGDAIESRNGECHAPGVDIAIWWLEARSLREAVFGPEVFSDADWAIMLDLYGSGAVGKKIQVTDLPAMTGLPSSTAGRHLRELIGAGWVLRNKDASDGRRTLIYLSRKGRDLMMLYFSELIAKMNRPPRDQK
jgi:DNA-binding MarR family transcriptional regulator